ncbi:hypothetical protein D3C73_1487340 [compost metagenome]
MLMTAAEHVARHHMPAPRGDVKPAHGQRLILGDALPVQQNLPKQRLGIEDIFAGGHQNGLGRTGRAFFEHGLERIAVEDFLTAQLKTHTSTQRRNRL